MLSFRLSDEFVTKYQNQKPKWGFDIGAGNSLSELTFLTKYSRLKEDGTKERWDEVCRRCIEGMYSILKDHCKYQRTPWNEFKAQKAAEDAFDRMFNFKWTPPGRGMWAMGTQYVHETRNNAALNNCSFISTEKLSTHSAYEATMPFMRLMEMSMNGVGVGFDTRGAGKLTIWEPQGEPIVWQVPDTREGWAESVGKLLETYFFKNRQPIEFDYSIIRPAGAPLKTFGGTASGPDPLQFMHDKIRNLFADRHGEKITSRDIVDIMNLAGKAVVAGGARRSALIALGSPDDDDYISLKDWNLEQNAERTGPDGWAWTSNNSVIANVGDDLSHLIDRISLNGEPGVVWLDLMRQYGRMVDGPNNKDYRVSGCNPCFSGDTLVGVADGRGAVPFRELAESGDDVPVYTINPSSGEVEIKIGRAPRKTGELERLLRIHFNDGSHLDVTPNHKMFLLDDSPKEAKDLVVGDRLPAFTKRQESIKNGSDKKYWRTYTNVYDITKRVFEHRLIALFNDQETDLETVWIDDKLHALKYCKICGIKRIVTWGNRHQTFCSISCKNRDDKDIIKRTIGLREAYRKKAQRESHNPYIAKSWTDFKEMAESYNHVITEIEWLDGHHDVYNITTDDNNTVAICTRQTDHSIHGIFTFQCAEIGLDSHEFCNLAELYPVHHSTFDDFKKTIKHAYMYVKAVTLMPSIWPETNEVITRNRRVGVSMTGIVEFVESRSWMEMRDWMDEGYKYLTAVDVKYSEWLGVRESIKLSTVKPAGTTSIIAGTTSGVHWPTTSGWYIRRIRFHKTDPLVKTIEAAGYKIEDDVNDKHTVVAAFPTKGLNVRSERDVSIWEKANLAAMAQKYWADNMVSVTVSFTDAERGQITPLLQSLQGQLKSVSFLPITDSGTSYAQAPYEPISENEALKLLKNVKPFDFDALYSAGIEGEGERFCTTDVCEIKL